MSARRAVRAALTAATAAALVTAGAPAAHAEPTPFGETVRTSYSFGPWTLDATCHFGPTEDWSLETRQYVQGVAHAVGAVETTIRCWVDHGGWWTNSYEETAQGSAAVVYGDHHLWSGSWERICVSATAVFVGVDTFVAPPVCIEA